jgi:16S rRNA (cytidine1402-2'-O)-methyltransferase
MAPQPAPPGRLVVCPTPIGNLEDVTLRVLRILSEADMVACEDTRHTRALLERHAIEARLVSYHEHNEGKRAPELLERVRQGALVALVSDAGTPLVSDPGFRLVRGCIEAGLPIEVLPGPSAVITALVVSGLATTRWCFAGFLPRGRRERERLLSSAKDTLVAFESPNRVASTLELLAALEPGREVALCRELSKLHEEVRRGSARELAEQCRAAPPRGEIVLVVAGAAAAQASRREALEALERLIEAGARPRPAASAVAALTGVSANELYRAVSAG